MFEFWRKRRVSVGTKFGLITALGTALVMAISIAMITHRLGQEDAVHSEEVARDTAIRIGGAVQNVFEGVFGIVSSTQDNLMALKDAGVTDPNVYDTIVKGMIVSGTYGYGAWLIWECNDAPLNGDGPWKARRDANGNLATYWHQNGMEMLRDVVPAEIYASDLYRVPKDSGKAYLLEPHVIEAANGDPTLVTSFSSPLERDGKVVGALGFDLKLGDIAEALAAIKLPDGASITVASDSGTVAMSTIKGLIGKPLNTANPALYGLLERAKRGDGSTLGPDSAGTDVLTSWNAIRFAGVKNPWYLLMKVPERSLLSTTQNDRVYLFVICASAVLAILVLVLATMSRMVAMPLKKLSMIINQLGEGLFDFEVYGRERKDEVGDIARAVERLQDSGLEIARLQEASGENEYQRQLARRAELDGISDQFSRSIEVMVVAIEGVASTVETQSREVSATTQAAVGRLGDVSDASGVARTSMASVATATSSLLSTIASIGDQIRQGQLAAEKVERHTVSTDNSISKLKQTIHEIDTVAALIRQVASQINLIALNATIEAARAGEAGRGFAVVAQEIKTLATQTARATEEIVNQISAVQNASSAADRNIVEMREAFVEMHTISVEIGAALQIQLGATDAINGLVEKAIGSAGGVDQHMSELVRSSRQVESAADVMLAQSGSLGQEIGRLSKEAASFLRFLKAA